MGPGADMWIGIDKRMAEITGTEIEETIRKEVVAWVVLGNAEMPGDVAAFVSFLLEPDSDYMNVQAPPIDGGL